MVIFHDHSDIKSSAPPLRQCRSFYSSYFLWGNYFLSLRLTLLVCSHFRSIIPIKFFSFSVLLSRRSKNWPPSNTYEWIWPCTFFFFFLAVYQSVLVVSLKEWEKKKMRDPEMRGTHSKHQSLLVCLAPSALGCSLELNIRSRYEAAYVYYFCVYAFLFSFWKRIRNAWAVAVLRNHWMSMDFFINVFPLTLRSRQAINVSLCTQKEKLFTQLIF